MSAFPPGPSIDRIKSARGDQQLQSGLELLFVQSHIEMLSINSFDGDLVRVRRSVPGVPDVTSILINDSNENLLIVSEKKEITSSHPIVGVFDMHGQPVLELMSNGSEENHCCLAGLGICRCCTMDFTVLSQDQAIGHIKQKFGYKQLKYEITDESMNVTHRIESNKYQDQNGMHHNPVFSVYNEQKKVISQVKKLGPRFGLKMNSNLDIKLKGILVCFFLHVNNTCLHNTAGKDRMVPRSTPEQPLMGKNPREKTLNLLYSATVNQSTPMFTEPKKFEDKVDEEGEEEFDSNDHQQQQQPPPLQKHTIIKTESRQENHDKTYNVESSSNSLPRVHHHQQQQPQPKIQNREIEDFDDNDSDDEYERNRVDHQPRPGPPPAQTANRDNLFKSREQVEEKKENEHSRFEKPGFYGQNNNSYLNEDSDD